MKKISTKHTAITLEESSKTEDGVSVTPTDISTKQHKSSLKQQSRYLCVYSRCSEQVDQNWQFEAPVFVQPPVDVHVLPGQCVKLVMICSGNPKPVLQMYKSGAPIPTDGADKQLLITDANNPHMYSFIIENVTLDDQAEYACQARNLAGTAWWFANVVVESTAGKFPLIWFSKSLVFLRFIFMTFYSL